MKYLLLRHIVYHLKLILSPTPSPTFNSPFSTSNQFTLPFLTDLSCRTKESNGVRTVNVVQTTITKCASRSNINIYILSSRLGLLPPRL